MVKRKNHLIILCILLLVASITTIIVKNIQVEKEKIANVEETVIDVNRDDIDTINWNYSNNNISFVKEEGVWYLSVDKQFPVDQDAINVLLDEVCKVDVSFVIEEVTDYDQYGLTSPKAKVSFSTSKNEYTIEFGNYSSMDEERYINIADGNVYLLTTDIMDDFNKTIDDFFDYEEVPNVNNFKELVISGETDLDIVYDDDNDYTYSKLFTYFLKNKNYKTLGNSKVESLANVMSNIEFTGYASYTANNEDLSKYGLDDPRITLKFNYLDEDDVEQEFIIYLSSDVIPEDEDEEVTYYARIDGSDNVYTINESVFSTYDEATYDSLRPSEVLLLDFKDVEQIDIELDDEKYEIHTKVDGDDITYTMNDEEITFADVVEDIQALQIEEYTNDISDKALQLSLKLYINNEDFSPLTIKIYKYNSENSLLVFNDSYKALVNRQDVVNLIEEINNSVLD